MSEKWSPFPGHVLAYSSREPVPTSLENALKANPAFENPRRQKSKPKEFKDITMTSFKLFVLPGDGIGPEVMAEVEKIAGFFTQEGTARFEIEHGLVGGAAYDAHGASISEDDMARAGAADAILFGAVGGPKWADVPYDVRPEAGLLRLRKDFGLFANLRPAICYPALAASSSLKRELVDGLDIMIVRELTGGVYFGEPKEILYLGNGQKRAIDTQVYDTYEIERIGRVAFELARRRRNKVTSSEKHNVMKSGVLWREVIIDLHKRHYSDVELEHQLADALGMQLVRRPKQFDVIVTDNLFGDMLSDVAAMLTGSLGMLPSASLGETDLATGLRRALYEPVHGSAPDIAGQGLANPIAMIGSFGMALRYSFGLTKLADRVEAAIASVLDKGLRTADIKGDAADYVSTTQMGDAVLAELQAQG
jgi:3-isopropylmalate dehydrogenase